jgi:hypothetical protein
MKAGLLSLLVLRHGQKQVLTMKRG